MYMEARLQEREDRISRPLEGWVRAGKMSHSLHSVSQIRSQSQSASPFFELDEVENLKKKVSKCSGMGRMVGGHQSKLVIFVTNFFTEEVSSGKINCLDEN